ncbi:LrgB family protein [Acinetobacter guerrae]|uniref:LrgB family protein n=1 Tax=Acinetobacter guerrae TaxID=1843371 RepID=A0A3A8E5P6_9GAMM|nr:LrgB family protein [Acinetobacter guerrae]RKG30392.1 LrgB family protein [Acinetobacter guerrae]
MNIALICLTGTILGYILAKPIYRRLPYLPFSPAILLPVIIIVLLLIFHVSYDTYMQDNQWIIWMLGPTSVAFAIPIYEYRHVIKEHALSIGMGIIVGMTAGMVSAFYLARLFHFDQQTTYSLMSRSISTPFAMELTQHIGGSVELVILFTIITGIVGIVFGDLVLAGLKLKSYLANGASLGNAAHGFGTSKAYMRNKEEGVIASLTMVLAGIFMVITGPFLVHVIVKLLT